MNIAYASSEVAPFSKTGGLADVAFSLPKWLSRLGNNVVVISPKYKSVSHYFEEHGIEPKRVGMINVKISNKLEGAALLEYEVDHVRFIFIEKDKYYDREHLYTTPSGDYEDNAERFIFFSRAILETLIAIDFSPDIIHTNDWQTGLTNAYLKLQYNKMPIFKRARSVFTIHNIAYHGLFWHWDMHLTGLGWEEFVPEKLEFHGKINLLKAGIVYSDIVTTVSKRYAEEIQTPEFGYGLEGVLQTRKDRLYGIINGVDYDIWDPSIDEYIPQNYDINDLEGKVVCKTALQKEAGLKQDKDAPLLATITRLAEQKGIDLMVSVLPEFLQKGAQFVILAFGDADYLSELKKIQKKFPKQVKIFFEFSEPLAHRIEAGADIYLMPSRYEPCGLNQLYSLRYGTVPVVHNTGGLADTVIDISEDTGKRFRATGFKFFQYTAEAFSEALNRAIDIYTKDKTMWLKIMRNGMAQDWSWRRSAEEYIKVYRLAFKV